MSFLPSAAVVAAAVVAQLPSLRGLTSPRQGLAVGAGEVEAADPQVQGTLPLQRSKWAGPHGA